MRAYSTAYGLKSASRAGFKPKSSSCSLLSLIRVLSIGSTFCSSTSPARTFATSSINCSIVGREVRQFANCLRDVCGSRISSCIVAKFPHSLCVLRIALAGLSPPALARLRSCSITPHCMSKHCLARLKLSLSATRFCQYGSAIAIPSALNAPMTCIHPLHSALVMHSGHQSIQNRQYSSGGFAAFAASASAFINWLVSMSVPQIALR